MSTPLQTETVAMFSAVAFMFSSVILKFVTMRLIVRMNQTIKEVQDQKALLLNELRNASTQLAIQERNKAAIERMLVKREKKMRELSLELQAYLEEDDERRESKRKEIKKQLSCQRIWAVSIAPSTLVPVADTSI